MPQISLEGAQYALETGDTVLDALLRGGAKPSFSCRVGACNSCILRCIKGAVAPAAQAGLRQTLREQGYFLACQFKPEQDISLAPLLGTEVFVSALVAEKSMLGEHVCRFRLHLTMPFAYRAGQFVNLRRADGLCRSYSLASVSGLDHDLEIHVKRMKNGRMSNWLHDQLQVGDSVELDGPSGDSCYLPGREQQPLLLIGTGTGLAPLLGIIRDALANNHRGPIHLYHGSRYFEGLYLMEDLRRLARANQNLSYSACLSGKMPAGGCRQGRADDVAFSDIAQLAGWRVYVCGVPAMARSVGMQAYLAGTDISDIYQDAFELTELRSKQR